MVAFWFNNISYIVAHGIFALCVYVCEKLYYFPKAPFSHPILHGCQSEIQFFTQIQWIFLWQNLHLQIFSLNHSHWLQSKQICYCCTCTKWSWFGWSQIHFGVNGMFQNIIYAWCIDFFHFVIGEHSFLLKGFIVTRCDTNTLWRWMPEAIRIRLCMCGVCGAVYNFNKCHESIRFMRSHIIFFCCFAFLASTCSLDAIDVHVRTYYFFCNIYSFQREKERGYVTFLKGRKGKEKDFCLYIMTLWQNFACPIFWVVINERQSCWLQLTSIKHKFFLL